MPPEYVIDENIWKKAIGIFISKKGRMAEDGKDWAFISAIYTGLGGRSRPRQEKSKESLKERIDKLFMEWVELK